MDRKPGQADSVLYTNINSAASLKWRNQAERIQPHGWPSKKQTGPRENKLHSLLLVIEKGQPIIDTIEEKTVLWPTLTSHYICYFKSYCAILVQILVNTSIHFLYYTGKEIMESGNDIVCLFLSSFKWMTCVTRHTEQEVYCNVFGPSWTWGTINGHVWHISHPSQHWR